MCIIQRYTRWNCGCLIEENDQALVKICVEKARNADAKCTLYVVPAFGENMPASDGYPSPQERYDSSSDSGDSDDTCCGDEDMVDPKEGHSNGVEIAENEGEPLDHDDGDRDDDNIDSQEHTGEIVPEPLRVAPQKTILKKPSQETFAASAAPETSDMPNPRDSEFKVNSSDINNCDDIDEEGEMDGWYDKSFKDEIRASNIRSRRAPVVASPRMCPEHEAKFENFANAYWRSETLWLRPKMRNHGQRACQDLALAQRCADRLWELYLVWKFFNGGDPHGAVIATAANFTPLYRYSNSVDGFSGNDDIDRKLKGVAEVDACCTLQTVSRLGDVTYRVLQWALDDLLTVLRDMLHPLEMLA